MAGTITGVLERIQTQQGRPQMAELVLTCTAAADDNSYPATVANDLAVTSDSRTFDIRGLKLYSVKIIPSAVTAPTAASDLTITDDRGVDLLGGKGADIIPNTGSAWIPAGPSGYALPALITGDITVNISGNSVASAIITIILELCGD